MRRTRATTSFTRRTGMTAVVAAMSVATLPMASARGQRIAREISDLHHTGWKVGKDLPISGVREIARTPDGYMWLGSTAGLIRFDGVRFVVLNDANTPALRAAGEAQLASQSALRVAPLLVDRSGTMWVRRGDGSLLHYRDREFRVVLAADRNTPRIDEIFEDGRGRIWLYGPQDVRVWSNGRLVPSPIPDSLWRSGIRSIVRDTGSGVWLGARSGHLWHIAENGTAALLATRTPDEALTPLLQTRDGTLFAQERGLTVFANRTVVRSPVVRSPAARATSGREPQSPLPRIPSAAVEAPDGSVWITSAGDGLVRWRRGTLEQFTARDGLTSANASQLLFDDEGSLWITTQSGLDRLRTAAFVTIGPRHNLPIQTPLNAFADASGGVWTMDYGSLQSHLVSGGIVAGEDGPITATRAPSREIPFASAQGGGIWRSKLHSDLVIRFRNGRTERVRPTELLAWNGTRVGLESADGTLWLGSRGGGFGYVRQLEYHPVALPAAAGMHDSIGKSAAHIGAMIGGARGTIWATEWEQPVVYEIAPDGSARRFDCTADVLSPMRPLTHAGGDTVWAATLDGALVRVIHGRAKSIVIPEVRRAIIAGSVTLAATRTHLWLGSQGGIGRLSLAALNAAADSGAALPVAEWFGDADGLTSARTTEHDNHAGFRATDGRLWFTTPAGLAVVNPEEMPANAVAPVPLIEEMLVAHGTQTTSGAREIEPNPDRVELHFTAASLRLPERVRLFYRLEGADPDWVPVNNSRVATYSRLREGNYLFRVRAINESGVPSTHDATLAFRVLPEFYETGTFISVVLLSLTSMIVGVAVFIQRRQHRADTQRMRERYETVIQERTRVARELHDTLLQGFSGITLQLQALKLSLPEAASAARDRLARVLLLADDTLRDARHSIWDMRLPELESQSLVSALEAAAKDAVAESSIVLQFSARGTPRPLSPAVETALLRIAKEAVYNAVRHSACRRVTMEFAYSSRDVQLCVEDDGDGFDAHAAAMASKSGHFGVAGMRERATRAGGTLSINGVPGVGTKLLLVISTTETHE